MLLRTLLRRQQQQHTSTSSRTKAPSPHQILGVHPGASLDDVKRRYRELARLHHPDMPTGSQHRFREITAAYQIIRTQAALNSGGGNFRSNDAEHSTKKSTASRTPPGSHPRGAESEESTASSSANAATSSSSSHAHSQFVFQYLWHGDGVEWLATFFGCLVLGVWTVDTFYFRGAVGASRARLHGQDIHHYTDSFHPSSSPEAVLEGSTLTGNSGRVAEAKTKPALLPSSSLTLRERLQVVANTRRYTDIREFVMDNEPSDNVEPRRVTVTRFTADLVDESSIPKKCVHVRSFDGNVASFSADPFASTLLESLADSVEATTYARDDAKTASLLAMYAMHSVPRVSPQGAKWVVVDYRPVSTKLQGRGGDGATHTGATTECLFAVENLKYRNTPSTVAQVVRIVVHGAALDDDENPLPEGARGGVIKLRDVPSFPKDFYRPKV